MRMSAKLVLCLSVSAIGLLAQLAAASTDPAGDACSRGLAASHRPGPLDAEIADVYRVERALALQRGVLLPECPSDVLRAQLTSRVTTSIRHEQILSTLTGRFVSSADLDRERERIERETTQPEALHAIYAALGNDARRIEAAVVRPALIERSLWLAFVETGADPTKYATWLAEQAASISRRVIERSVFGTEIASESTPSTDSDPLECLHEGWLSGGLLTGEAGGCCGASAWTGTELLVWTGVAPYFYNPATDTWRFGAGRDLDTSAIGVAGRAVWTGNSLIVPSGERGSLRSGAEFILQWSAIEDRWTSTSTFGIADDPVGVFTGTEVLLSGGWQYASPVGCFREPNTTSQHASYDPASRTYTPLPSPPVPLGIGHAAVWTGSEELVWGGERLSFGLTTYSAQGAGFDPALDSWRVLAASPLAPRSGARFGWSGSELIVWGGRNGLGALIDGAAYDPQTDQWRLLSTVGAPGPGASLARSAVWSGAELLIAGAGSSPGFRYDPTADAWRPMSQAPVDVADADAYWTGSQAIYNASRIAIYDPVTDSWALGRDRFTPLVVTHPVGAAVVDTGTDLIVWSGNGDGRRFNYALATWFPISAVGEPAPDASTTAVWTGAEVLIWGGAGGSAGRYDPVSDSWNTMSRVGEPNVTFVDAASAVWSGSEMIIGVAPGGRYDPVTDTWSAMSESGAPNESRAAWNGTRLIALGRQSTCYLPREGASYDPATDAWSPIDTLYGPVFGMTPVARDGIVYTWGGTNFNEEECISRRASTDVWAYDGDADRWDRVAIGRSASEGRLVADAAGLTYSGGEVYYGDQLDPGCAWEETHFRDSVQRLSLGSGASIEPLRESPPLPLRKHRAFHVSGKLLVFDPVRGNGAFYSLAETSTMDADEDGFSVCLDCDDMDDTTNPGAPEGCGSADKNCNGISGDVPDNDGDGYTACQNDCDDTNPNRYPGAAEICGDGIDNNCDGIVDNIGPDNDRDGFESCRDCNDASASVWGRPIEITGLSVTGKTSTTLAWDDMRPNYGLLLAHDVASGLLQTLLASQSHSGASCLRNNLQAFAYVDTRSTPPVGNGYYYVVRGQNACGTGSYGSALADTTLAACP